MKKILQKVIVATVLCFCVFLLSACNGGIKGAEAKACVNEFFVAVAAEDYSKAESLLHPMRPFDLKVYFDTIEKENDVDFREGIVIEKYTGFASSFYDSNVDGSTYQLTMQTMVGGKEAEFVIDFVKNEDGYGIYNFEVEI